MSKPIVTYMRKKNRSAPQDGVNQASPPSIVSDTHYSKRSRAQYIAYKPSETCKKPRTSAMVLDELDLQTPHPTAMSESQVFKLQSSRGQPLSPTHEFSPMPLSRKNVSNAVGTLRRRAYMRRNNIYLKENAPHNDFTAAYHSHFTVLDTSTGLKMPVSTRSSIPMECEPNLKLDGMFLASHLAKDLASPFSSRPWSPISPYGDLGHDSLEAGLDIIPKERATNNKLHSSGKFDHLNSRTSGQIRSTTTSPSRSPSASTLNDEIIGASLSRRPSAPTTFRPRLDAWSRLLPQVSDSIFELSTVEQDRHHSSALLPSALEPTSSCFENALRSATFKERENWIWSDAAVDFNRPPSQLSFNSDLFDDVQGASTPLRGVKDHREDLDNEQETERLTVLGIYATRNDLHEFSAADSWITDSLISAPSVYHHHKNKADYSKLYDHDETNWRGQDDDVDSDEDYEDVLDSVHDDKCGAARPPARRGSGDLAADRATQTPDEIGLVFSAQTLSVKDDGLGLSVPPSTDYATVKTTKSGESSPGFKTRKRRGTIRASEVASQIQKTTQGRRNRSGTVIGPPATRRTRSGTIIGPTSLTRATQSSAKVKTVTSEGMDRSTDDVKDPSNTMVVDEDELNLFKEEWVEEPWIVAEPPSPIVSKRKSTMRSTRIGKVLQRRIALKNTPSGIRGGITEKGEVESEDELLLKSISLLQKVPSNV